MKLKWSSVIESNINGIWPPNYEGVFYSLDYTYFYYRNNRTLKKLTMNHERILNTCMVINSSDVDLPNTWAIIEAPSPVMKCSNAVFVDLLSSKAISDTRQVQSDTLFQNWEQRSLHLVEGSYTFGDYVVSHKGRTGFVCHHQGRQIWSFRARGYLYTDMKLFSEKNLFFGTDGMGGRFYILNIETGQIIAEHNTGGTNQIIKNGDTCFIFQRGNPARVLQVSLESGDIISAINLNGHVDSCSRLYKIPEGLFATSFEIKNRIPVAIRMSFVEL